MTLQRQLVVGNILRFWVATLGEVGSGFLAAGMPGSRSDQGQAPGYWWSFEPLAWAGYNKAA